ncbi:MAG: TOPRIM nucleotidyl transferase/hydrolase domain-containing protein [Candidatus Hodarchaeales archaeon]
MVIFYHPYQILIIKKILSSVSSVLNYVKMESRDDLARRFEEIKPFYDKSKEYFLKNKPSLIKQVGLLLRLQNAYQPIYRQSFIPSWKDVEGDYAHWLEWKKEVFDATEVVEKCHYTVKQISDFRDWLAAQALFIDPNRDFYMLFRLIPHRKKTKLKDKALLAQDYYEFVGVLNLFLYDLTGEVQPESDEIIDLSGGSWKKRIYGDPFSYQSPVIRRKIVENYIHNSIPKLLLLVEGETEEESIPIIATSMGFYLRENGVEIYNYEGTGGIKGQNIRGTLDTAKKHGTMCYVITDNDERAQEYIDDLVRENLLNEENYVIWDKEYEDDNFGIDGVLSKINAAIENNGLDSIKKTEIQEEIKKGKFLMKSIEDVIWNKYHFKIYSIISKTELGIFLALDRAEEIKEERKAKQYNPKMKIEKILLKISKKI